MRNLILFLAVLTGLYSCSCSYHVRKVKSKCGYTSDTIYKHDTTIVDRIEKDTVFNYYQKDTVIIREGRLTMKYFYNHSDSTVYLNGECDTVRVVKRYPVAVNKYVSNTPKWVYFVLLAMGLLCLYAVFKRR